MIEVKIREAISKKINKICKEQDISINKLASVSCLTQSTVQHLAEGNSKNPKLLTIIRICDGLDITIREFFNCELFDDLEQEIK